MKIFVNDECVYELNDTQLKVLADEINKDVLEADIKRRVSWVIKHKYERCFERIKKQYEPFLAAHGHNMVPTHPDALAELIFTLPEYKDRKKRDDEGMISKPVYDNQADDIKSK